MARQARTFANEIKDDLKSRFGDFSYDIVIKNKGEARNMGYTAEALIISEERFYYVGKFVTETPMQSYSLAEAMLRLNPQDNDYWVENINDYTVAVYKR